MRTACTLSLTQGCNFQEAPLATPSLPLVPAPAPPASVVRGSAAVRRRMGGGAASLLLLAGLFALRTHIGSNLELTARAVAYTVEAALVFRDAEDAQQTLARMLAS